MKKLFRPSVVLLISLFIGCSSDDNQDPIEGDTVTVDLEAAKLNDFKLSEVAYTDIDITPPEIVEGKEKKQGQIVITIPATADNLKLSLASVNFDESKFEIFPAVGSVQSFEVGSVILYTITSKVDPEKSLRYLVSVMKEEVQAEEKLKITGFRFEQSKNQGLSSDIEAKKIVEYRINNSNAIYILVPVGTDLTELVPSIDFEGELLEYRQGSGDFTAYPTTDLKVNFTSDYNVLNFTDKNEFVLSVKASGEQKKYRVIVDVENPIELQQSFVLTPNVTKGTIRNFIYKWVNKGNHPLQDGLKAAEYVDNTTNNKGNIYRSRLQKIITPTDIRNLIMPGEEGNVRVTVDADTNNIDTGNYDVNIVFSPKYDVNRAMINDIVDDLNPIEDIFNPITLNVKTTVISN